MLDDIAKFQAENLARVGGFTHRRIAAYVYNKPLSEVTSGECRSVSTYLSKRKISVWDWRNTRTTESQSFFNTVVKPKRKAAHKRKAG